MRYQSAVTKEPTAVVRAVTRTQNIGCYLLTEKLMRLIAAVALSCAFGGCAHSSAQPAIVQNVGGFSIVEAFFGRPGFWRGPMAILVTEGDGVPHGGQMVAKVDVDASKNVSIANAFVRPDGSRSQYEGSLAARVDGLRIVGTGDNSRDPNSGNALSNYHFEGWINGQQAAILEEYDETFPDGRKEHRRNGFHYLALTPDRVVMVGDIQIDGKTWSVGTITLERCADAGCP
jgi:hypothetical protein